MALDFANARSVVIGYGTDEGALTLGGLNNRGFSLLAIDNLDTYASFSFVALIQVIGRGADNNARAVDFNRKIAALKNLVRYSGSFSYQTDVNRSWATLQITNISGVNFTADVIDTSATGQFTSDDVGKVVEIQNVGSFQISGFTSANQVQVQLTPELDLPSTTTDLGRIGNDTFLIRETDKKNGFYARPVLQRVENPGDKKFRRTFIWTVVFQKPADSNKDTGRRDARITVVRIPGTNLRTVTMTGIYTALNTGVGTFQDAVAAFNAGIPAFSTNVLNKFGGVSNYELVGEAVVPDDEYATLTFTRTYIEKKNPDVTAGGGLNDTRITNQNFVVTRRANWFMGLPRRFAPITVQVNWTAQIDSDQVNSSQLVGFYTNTVKPGIIAAIKSDFGGNAVIDTELGTINKDNFVINVSMSVYIPNARDKSLYMFQKTVGYGLSLRKDTRDRWSGVDHEYTRFSPGLAIRGTVDIRVVRRGVPRHSGLSSLGFSPVAPSSGTAMSRNISDDFQAPGTPPFGSLNGSGNQWLLDSAGVTHTPIFRGNDLEGDSEETLFSDSNYSTSWLWGKEVVDNVVGNATLGGTIESTPQTGGSIVGAGLGGGAGVFGPSGRPRSTPSGRVITSPTGTGGAFAGGANTPGAPTRKRRRLPIPAGQFFAP